MLALIRSILLILACVSFAQVYAQSKFTINGRLKIDGGDINGARLVVYKNGAKERVINNGLSKFTMDLDINENYVLSFEKDGFVSKKLSFNTKVPASVQLITFTPFDFAVSIFKQYDDLNMVVFNQPVGVIRYEPAMGDFDYDTDYTKSIQSQLQEAIAEVERKQKEESQNAAADAKRKAADEKAQAKLEAEAQKQAIAQQKAQEQARVAAEIAAKEKEANEKAKAEALAKEEKRKAEESRMAEARAAKESTAQTVEAPPVKSTPVKENPPVQKPITTPVPQRRTPPTPPSRTVAPVRSVTDPVARRAFEPIVTQENSPVRSAEALASSEDRPPVIEAEVFTDRHEELFVEPNKVMTVVQLTTGELTTEYRKVIHKWGSTFYFKDGKACTQLVYEQEAMTDQLAGATPKSKFSP